MLHVVTVAEEDEYGNQPSDNGGVLVVGAKYTLHAGPVAPLYGGFTPWMWCVYTSQPLKEARELAASDASTFVAEADLTEKAILLVARNAVAQLSRNAEKVRARGLTREGRKPRVHTGTMADVMNLQEPGAWAACLEAAELAEFAQSVESYLGYQRWLCGY